MTSPPYWIVVNFCRLERCFLFSFLFVDCTERADLIEPNTLRLLYTYIYQRILGTLYPLMIGFRLYIPYRPTIQRHTIQRYCSFFSWSNIFLQQRYIIFLQHLFFLFWPLTPEDNIDLGLVLSLSSRRVGLKYKHYSTYYLLLILLALYTKNFVVKNCIS